MVRQGNFVLEVVYADSKDPFQEHYDASKGKTYAEVEPDIDYFIRVTNHGAGEVIMDYTVLPTMDFFTGKMDVRITQLSDSINSLEPNETRHQTVNTKAIGRVALKLMCANISHLRVRKWYKIWLLIGHQIRNRFWLG